MSTRSYALALGACASLLLTACGGGGGGGAVSPLPAPTTSAAAKSSARATATITIPKKTAAAMNAKLRRPAGKRAPSFVNQETAAVEIAATRSDGYAETSTTAVGAGDAGCTTNPDGSVTCTVPFNAPATSGSQTDNIVVQLLDNADPYGNSTSELAYAEQDNLTVSAGGANTFTFVCGGTIGTFPFLGPVGDTNSKDQYPDSGNGYIPVTSGSNVYSIIAEDVDAYTITGLLDSPITLTLSNTTDFSWANANDGSFLSSAATLNVPNLATAPSAKLSWDGIGSTTITVSSSGFNSNYFAANYYNLGPTSQFVTTYQTQAP